MLRVYMHHSNPEHHPLRREGRPLSSWFKVFHIWMQYQCKVHPRVWPAQHFFPLKHWRRNGVCKTKQLLCKKAKWKVTGLLFTSPYPKILLESGTNGCTSASSQFLGNFSSSGVLCVLFAINCSYTPEASFICCWTWITQWRTQSAAKNLARSKGANAQFKSGRIGWCHFIFSDCNALLG